jgi:ABC-type transporter Mla maintaining outer membrane lipid asymmetry ATPase subunit MlaF
MKRQPIETLQFQNMSVVSNGGKVLLENVNLALPMGRVVWFRGASGSGKSLLVKILSGLMNWNGGRYLINGQSVGEMDFEDFKPYALNIGYSFDFGGLLNNRTVRSNLLLPLDYHRAATPVENRQVVDEIMSHFELTEVADERPSAIVGGLRKATCVARAFVLDPQLLLLDDPTVGLRTGLVEQLKKIIVARQHSGSLRHVFVATDDLAFMKSFDPVIVTVRDCQLLIENQGKVA